MAAIEVFKMENPNNTCTAASLSWCTMVLSKLTTPRADLFEAKDPTIRAYMSNVETLDADPETQVAFLGFEVVKKKLGSVLSSTEIAEVFKNNAPHAGIFWNSFHTMGYAYSHLHKQYFDNNVGLYRAKKTADIVAKMEGVRKDNGYGNWEGYAVLRLKARIKL